jgi:hypothetical protein
MRIEKGGRSISTLGDWEQLAPPKRSEQWTPGRSAYELARAWCGGGGPAIPSELLALLDSTDETRSLVIECVHSEHRIAFDDYGGEPRNADLAFLAASARGPVAVTVEAKADEPFGLTVADTLADALERRIENDRSNGIRRVEALAAALFGPRMKGQPRVGDLRYQLLTAAAGSLAYAEANGASIAVLVVHEFVTSKTNAAKHERNARDLDAFLTRLGRPDAAAQAPERRVGPLTVPATYTLSSRPMLFVGKISTHSEGRAARERCARREVDS